MKTPMLLPVVLVVALTSCVNNHAAAADTIGPKTAFPEATQRAPSPSDDTVFDISHYPYRSRFVDIVNDFPSIGGSYAVRPLWWIVVCDIYHVECKWDWDGYSPVATFPYRDELLNHIYHAYTNAGSDQLLELLLRGETDIVITTKSPRYYEVEHHIAEGTALRYQPVVIDSLIFVVNPINTVDDLSVEDIAGLYSGAITNWQELGGKDEEIHLYRQELPYGSEGLLDILIPSAGPNAEAKEILQDSKYGLLCNMLLPYYSVDPLGDRVGIGYGLHILLGNYLGNELKAVNVNGVPPTAKMIARREYPLTVEFFVAMRAVDASKSTNQLYEYLLSDIFLDSFNLFSSPYHPIEH